MLAAESKVAPAGIAVSPKAGKAFSWRQIVEPVEPFLDGVTRHLARQVNEFDPALAPYADYALNGNGKHLRPILVALSANALGPVTDGHVKVAVIIEMVHLATLVHDDVMDEAQIRRGQLTLAANWGNDVAVLFGDCLFAQALKLAASFPTPEICRAVAMATNTVCAGEILQTQQRGDFERARQEYFRVLEMKTAELFALSCELGACLDPEVSAAAERAALRQFGLAFGTAYQVYDDCLDLFGSESAAGKSLGTDLAKGKLTLPILLAWERAGAADRAWLAELARNSAGREPGWRAAAMPHVGELLSKYETLNPSLEVVHTYLAKARRQLAALPESDGRAGLTGLADYLDREAALLADDV